MSSRTEYSDSELLKLFRNEDSKSFAFNLIVRQYQERLYWHIRKILVSHEDTNDTLQETFMKIWVGLEKFRADSKLYTWMYRIATNEALSLIKQKRRKFLLPIVDVEKGMQNLLESDSYFDGNEAQKKLQKAILRLPQKQRIVFNMKYFDEMKYNDMSEILDTTVGALKASYHHAVKKIEKFLETD
ncbi:MAG: sigma-70 family RNA polymerase sigma factor [Bacteroidetes bacterium]|nr:sigma-70 family RNA polymerase sigma factor [Bacteroidota bacterium]MBT6687070.1 sigma-70 family RNA polymerase sigma factor [Bacteroidota bacterium]MBT7142827.1 sigma-70 family RNA polymerase sigma factor [Bacteroidota bacterium]MBT7492642.1 sigma-70 family RNA polymerase sigma factor [Bacteroidota bacterium]